jgi:ferredoxin
MPDSTKTVELTIETATEIKKIKVAGSSNLLEVLIANSVSIPHSCGGYGICTTCRIICKGGAEFLGPRTEPELERSEERQFSEAERLACQCELNGSVHILLPSTF